MRVNEDARRWWALAAIGLSLLTISVDATILNVALPTLGSDLQASTRDLQWFVDSFTLAMAALLLPAGLLGDRYGRKKLLLTSLVVFGAASLWCAYSGSPGELIAARTVLGLGAAFMVPLATSVLLDVFEGEGERTKAIGVIAVSQSLGLPLGPIIGGALLDHFWWGSVFLINVPLIALGIVAVTLWVPDSRGVRGESIDLFGVLLSTVGLVGVVFGAIEAGETSWGDPRALVPLLGGVGLLLLFVFWEIRLTRTGQPLIDLSLFRSRGFVWGSLLGTVVSFAMFGLLFALPQYFQAVDGADALGTGLRLLPLIGGVLVSAGAVNKLPPEVAPRAVPAVGFALVAAGLYLGTRTELSSSYGYVSVWLVVVGLGLGLAMTRTMSAAVNSLAQESSGVGSALISALRQVGGSVGVAVLGTLANSAYRSNLDLGDSLPPEAVELAERSAAGGLAVGEKLHDPGVVHAVQDSFMTAMQTLLGVCAAIAAVAMVLAMTLMPKASGLRKDPERPDDVPAKSDVVV